MATAVTHRVSEAAHKATHSLSEHATHVANRASEALQGLRSESAIFEERAEHAVRRALDKVEGEAGYLGARINAKFAYLPYGSLSAALVWPTLAATGALFLYEYQGLEVNRARFARRSALLKPNEASTEEEPFERVYRLHQQTGEALITLIPSLYTFSLLVSPRWALALGGGWLASRIAYLYAHKIGLGSVEKPAYALSYISQMALLLGSAVNATRWSAGLLLAWIGTLSDSGEIGHVATPALLAPPSAEPVRTHDLIRFP